jgi:hypothetical protein
MKPVRRSKKDRGPRGRVDMKTVAFAFGGLALVGAGAWAIAFGGGFTLLAPGFSLAGGAAAQQLAKRGRW